MTTNGLPQMDPDNGEPSARLKLGSILQPSEAEAYADFQRAVRNRADAERAFREADEIAKRALAALTEFAVRK